MCGGLAQLGERNVRNVEVGGSIPLPSTNSLLVLFFDSSFTQVQTLLVRFSSLKIIANLSPLYSSKDILNAHQREHPFFVFS